MNKTLLVSLLSAALPLAVLPGSSIAASDSTTMNVSASVAGGCTVATATHLSFGAVDAFASSAAATEGEVSVTCNVGSAPVLSIDDGGNDEGVGQRRMADGSNYIGYNIVQPTGATFDTCAPGNTGWDSGNTLSAASLFSVTGGAKAVKVCGYTDVAPAEGFATGSYTDVVTISVSF